MIEIDLKIRSKVMILMIPIFLITGCTISENTKNEEQKDSSISKEEVFDKTKEHFDERATAYDKSIEQWGVFEPAHDLVLKEIRKLVFSQDARILDVACGTGKLTLRLAEKVPQGEVIGLDLSPKMIEEANKKVKDNSNVRFIVGNVEDMPFPDNYFDIVTCSYSFHHFPDSDAALNEMKRVLKDSGWLYIIDPYRSFSFGYIAILIEKWRWDDVKFYAPKEFAKLFTDKGFKDVYQKRQLRRLGLFSPGLLTVGRAEK